MIRAKFHTEGGKVAETTHKGEDTVIEIESLWEAIKILPTVLQIAALYYRYKKDSSSGSSPEETEGSGDEGSIVLKYGSLEVEIA